VAVPVDHQVKATAERYRLHPGVQRIPELVAKLPLRVSSGAGRGFLWAVPDDKGMVVFKTFVAAPEASQPEKAFETRRRLLELLKVPRDIIPTLVKE
jgi:hypothetical protein